MEASKQELFTEIHESDSEKLAGGAVIWVTNSGGGGGTFGFGFSFKNFTFSKTGNYTYSYGQHS